MIGLLLCLELLDLDGLGGGGRNLGIGNFILVSIMVVML